VTQAVVVMGVSGSGKSTLGRALADALGWRFVEGDALHPTANIAKMAGGAALDDADRQPFLAAVARTIADQRAHGIVVSCSALRRAYRDQIRAKAGEVVFVLPVLDRATLASRLAQRPDHFMPAALLDSQLAALEPPEDGEQFVVVDGTVTTSAQVDEALAALRARGQT
jgi:gluconokinase